MTKKQQVSKQEAKELRGNLRKVFEQHSAADVLKKLPGHLQLTDREGKTVDKKDSEAILSGIHERMLVRNFEAIATLVKKFTPKEQSKNAAKKARYKGEARAGKSKSFARNDGGMA